MDLLINFGTSEFIVPKGTISDNFEILDSKDKIYEIKNDSLIIRNVALTSGKIYKIGFKIGFLKS